MASCCKLKTTENVGEYYGDLEETNEVSNEVSNEGTNEVINEVISSVNWLIIVYRSILTKL